MIYRFSTAKIKGGQHLVFSFFITGKFLLLVAIYLKFMYCVPNLCIFQWNILLKARNQKKMRNSQKNISQT